MQPTPCRRGQRMPPGHGMGEEPLREGGDKVLPGHSMCRRQPVPESLSAFLLITSTYESEFRHECDVASQHCEEVDSQNLVGMLANERAAGAVAGPSARAAMAMEHVARGGMGAAEAQFEQSLLDGSSPAVDVVTP